MCSQDFWKLQWYDFNLWVEKIVNDRSKRNEDRELTMEMTRQVLSLVANVNRDPKKKAMPFEPSDFIRLSYDKEKKEAHDDNDLKDRLERLKQLFPDDVTNNK